MSQLPPEMAEIVATYALSKRPTILKDDAGRFVAFFANGIGDMNTYIDRVLCWCTRPEIEA